jgi:hypothetical protein
MAPLQSSSRLVWGGPLTIWQIASNLGRRKRTVLRLPTRYHPALSACLYSDMRTRTRIDLVGDADLLARIAEIDGLRELMKLVQLMQRARARVRLRSPAPHLIFNVPPEKSDTAHRGQLFAVYARLGSAALPRPSSPHVGSHTTLLRMPRLATSTG